MSPTGNGPAIQALTLTEGTWTTFSGECGTRVGAVNWAFYRNGTSGTLLKSGTFTGSSCTSNCGVSYTTVSADSNQSITSQVVACDSAGNCSEWDSAVYTPRPAPVNTVAPTISGTVKVGQTLTGTNGTWTGFAPITYTDQWQWSATANGTYAPISGATGLTYLVGSAYVNDFLRLAVTASNAGGPTTASSAASGVVQGVAPTAGTASISGTAEVGNTLTANASGFNLGTPTATYTYQWKYSTTSGGTFTNVSSGGTSKSYVVDSAYYNDYLKVVITATNTCTSGCGSASATSAASNQVLPAAPTGGSVSISGTAMVGNALTATACASQGWSPASPAPSCAFQWQVSANGTSGWSNATGSGATTASYTVAAADGGQYLRVSVTATNPGGSGVANSASTSQVLNRASVGTIPTDGTQSQTATISSPGYAIQGTFSGTAGQQIYLEWQGTGFSTSDKVNLYDPNGLPLLPQGADWSDGALSRFILPGTGTYTVDAVPSGVPASASFNLWFDPPDVNAGTIPLDGQVHTFNIPTPGQYGYFTFSGSAGQWFFTSFLGIPGTQEYAFDHIQLIAPDGSLVAQRDQVDGGIDRFPLPQTGTYKLEYQPDQDPRDSTTGVKGFTADLAPPSSDDMGGMPMNSSSTVTINPTEGGKRAWRVFSGQAGEPVTVSWTGTGGSGKVEVDRLQLNADSSITDLGPIWGPGDISDGSTGTLTLPATGPYLIFVNPKEDQYSYWALTDTFTITSPWVVPLQQEKGCDAAGNGTNNSAFMGDVNTLTGTYSTSVGDISLPGLGIPLTFSRCYSSAYASTNGVLGYGWNNSFGAKLAIDGQGNATLTDEDLQKIGYTKQADGSYLSSFSSSTLTKLGDGTYQIVKHGGDTYHFDANGNLLSVKDRNGEGLTYAYNGSNQLTTVTDQEGRTATLHYNADGTLHDVGFSDGRSVSFGYTSGNLTSFTDVRGKTWTYAYDGNHQLTSIQDPNLNYPIRNTYTNGQVTSQQDANGNSRSFSYGSNATLNGTFGPPSNAVTLSGTVTNPQVTTLTDAAGKKWTDTYADNELVSRVDPLGNVTSFTYDGSGNKLTSTDPKGHTTTMTYDGNGNMLTMAAPASLGYPAQVWTYNGFNEVVTHKDYRGNTTTYNYDANGNLQSIVKPGNLTTTLNLHPGNPELVDSVQNARGYTTNYGYNALNQLTSVTDPDGNKTTYGYDSAGRRTTVTTPRGNTTSCQNTQGCPAQYTTTTVYDAAGHKLSVTDGLGNKTSYTYDPAGNLQTMVDPIGNATGGNPSAHTTSYAYDNANDLAHVTAPGSPQTTIVYDNRGLVSSRTDALGDKTSYTYNDSGWLKTVTSPNGNTTSCQNTQGCPAQYTTTYTYDGDGNRASVVNALGGETDYTYDALDRLTLKVVHGAQAGTETTNYSYDANGNLTQVIDPAGRTTTRTYTALNQVQTIVDPIGNTNSCQTTQGCPAQHTTTYAYNNDGKLSSVTGPTPTSSQTTYGYDNADLLTSMVSPLGNVTGCGCASQYTTTYSYDSDGNLQTVTDPDQHTTTTNYDPDERPMNSYDPLNRETQWQYDANGNLVKAIANDQSFTLYGYDALNHLTSVQDARGYTTNLTPNVLGQLTKVVDPVGDTTTYAYDADGNRYQTIDAIANHAQNPSLGTTTLTFNGLDEPTNVSYSDGTHSVGYVYDLQGNLTSRADAQGTTNYAYNLDNQVTGVTLGSSGYGYGYDGNGRLGSETYPNGTSVTYGYDSNSNLNSVLSGSQTTSYVYDANNRLTSETLPSGNGYVATFGYDNAGLLNSVTNKKGTTTLSSYTISQRYADGAPQTLNAQNNGSSWTESYSYDPVGRLASVCYQSSCPNQSDPKVSWIYDPDGNRSQETRANNVVTTYAYNNADRLQSATKGSTVTNYTYNYDGQQTGWSNGTSSATYTWNLAGEMKSATVAGATTNYTYDGAGMRTQSVTGANTINYSWDEAAGGLPTLASETNGSGAALRTYLYGPSSSPLGMTTPSGTFYYHYDSSGNVADLTNSTGATQWAYSYEPYGLIRSATNVSGSAPTNPFQYAGQYTDTASGLSDLRARNYDPSTGSFLSTDPAGASTTVASSPYAYANDLPLVYSDPSGLSPSLSSFANSVGNAASSLGGAATAVYNVAVNPLAQLGIQTAEDVWSCATRQTHCAGAAFGAAQVALLFAPGGLEAEDLALAENEAMRAGLRDVATSIGDRIVGGLNRLATEEAGGVSRLLADETGSARVDLGLSDVFSSVKDSITARVSSGAARLAAGDEDAARLATAAEDTAKGLDLQAQSAMTAQGESVSVFHGSFNDAAAIRQNGLDLERSGSTYVSRDRAAAEDAIGPKRVAVEGPGRDPGVIESRVPRAVFDQLFGPEEPYQGFFPYSLSSTQIQLSTVEQRAAFNRYIVP